MFCFPHPTEEWTGLYGHFGYFPEFSQNYGHFGYLLRGATGPLKFLNPYRRIAMFRPSMTNSWLVCRKWDTIPRRQWDTIHSRLRWDTISRRHHTIHSRLRWDTIGRRHQWDIIIR